MISLANVISHIKKNKLIYIASFLLGLLFIFSPDKGLVATGNAFSNFKSVGMVLPQYFY